MRSILVLVVAVIEASCAPRSPALPREPSLGSQAIVTPDSAIFIIPVSPRTVWEWNMPDTSQTGISQYSLNVTWNAPGSWQGEGVGLRLFQPVEAKPRQGSLDQLISAGSSKSFVPSSRISGWETSPEPKLSKTVRGNRVTLILRKSEMLSRLIKAHPAQVYFTVRLPNNPETNSSVTVDYRQ
jgi:hypothetical protein